MKPKRGLLSRKLGVGPWLPFVLILFALPIAEAEEAGTRAAAEENYLHHTVYATVLVADAEAAADRIAAWSERVGGYYLLKSTELVVFRFPYQRMGALRDFLKEVGEEVIEISPQAVDLREEVLGLRSRIRSREEILAKNLSYIDQADVEGTLAIEQEVMQLLKEIEGLKGRLRKLETDRVLSRGEVALSFMQQTVPEDLPSSFEWINTVDFYRFMKGGY